MPVTHGKSRANFSRVGKKLRISAGIDTFNRGGELSAVVELCRLFPGILDNASARACARTVAAWKALPEYTVTRRARPRSGSGPVQVALRPCTES